MKYKNLTHTIRDIMEGKQEDPNAEDLAKLKKVAKVKDEKDVEEKLDEKVLEFGTDAARDKYSDDTPGQTTGVDHNPEQHRHDKKLAVDGVPVPGGAVKKPDFDQVVEAKEEGEECKHCNGTGKHGKEDCKSCNGTGMIKEAHIKNCGCGEDPCKTYGSKEDQLKKNVKEEVVSEKSAAEVLKKRYASYDPDDNPQATKRVKDHIPGMKTYKLHPDAKLTDRGYSKKGKMAALKKQHERRPEQYGITKEDTVMMTGKKEKTLAAIKKKGDEAVAKANAKLRGEQVNSILDDIIHAYNLQEAMSSAEKAARADAARDKDLARPKVDPADVDHSYKPAKKRGRGERDLPHITTQLRGVVDMGTKHSGVKFKDGKTVKVHPDHAKSWLKKHDSAKPAQKLAMYKSHDSHSEFSKHK